MADAEQTQKMVPLITCEISLCQYVCELILGVNVFDLDFWVQIDSIKQPIKSNSVGSGNMSHCRTSSLYNHLDHNFVVFKHMSQSILMRRLDFGRNTINIVQIIDHSLRLLSFLKREVKNELHVCSLTSLPVLYHSDSCFEELSDP